MKIGILTFHSELNYGGVLQCWALQTFLDSIGYDVVVIDKRLEDSRNLQVSYLEVSFITRLKWIVKSLLGSNDFSIWRRAVKTYRFIVRNLRLSKYHFIDWRDAPKDLGVDVVVVGSDQVWHGGNWGDPRPYLSVGEFEGARISYGASLGMLDIPNKYAVEFRNALPHFHAVSVREKSARILLKAYRDDISVVVDPTLIVDSDAWLQFCRKKKTSVRKYLVCYFLQGSETSSRDILTRFSDEMGYVVDVFMNDKQRTRRVAIRNLMQTYRNRFSQNVRFRYDADPRDFVEAFQAADVIIADSFHALMFSAIFRKNFRILRPVAEWARISFDRIRDFCEDFILGDCEADSLDSALASIRDGYIVGFNELAIRNAIHDSRQWLEKNLKECDKNS